MNELDQLKTLVLQSKDLQEPINYFYKMIDADRNFIEKNNAVHWINDFQNEYESKYKYKYKYDCPELLTIMDIIKADLVQRLGITTINLITVFFEMYDYSFIYGLSVTKELLTPAAIIYFSDIRTGIFSTMETQAKIFRFSLMESSEMK